jgi:hypothetical protein
LEGVDLAAGTNAERLVKDAALRLLEASRSRWDTPGRRPLEDSVSVLSGVSARDSYNRALEKAVSDSNPPHRMVASSATICRSAPEGRS